VLLGSVVDALLLVSAAAVACCLLGWKEFHCLFLGLLADVFIVCYFVLPYGFDVCSREPVPFDSRLIQGVCSL